MLFGFLGECLRLGVEEACDARGRGGFHRIRSQGSDAPIEFEIYYRETPGARPITYELAIDEDDSGRPLRRARTPSPAAQGAKTRPAVLVPDDERRYRESPGKEKRQGQQIDKEEEEFDLRSAHKTVIETVGRVGRSARRGKPGDGSRRALENKRKLGIATLGALKQHPRIASFRRFLEGWYLSYFTPDAARSLPLAGPQRHLNLHGDNLGNVVQFMEREHPARFRTILERISEKVPGIDSIDTAQSPDGRLLLRFNDGGFDDPFYAQQMSDGTLKIFAYLLMLEDPQPPPFICIEEPENGLYHKLLELLAGEFRSHATGRKGASQIFVTTHQPYFVDALDPEETWVLEKKKDGFSEVTRASDDAIVKAMVEEGLPLGGLWYSDYLDRRTLGAP